MGDAVLEQLERARHLIGLDHALFRMSGLGRKQQGRRGDGEQDAPPHVFASRI
jgi:hypothetical protein